MNLITAWYIIRWTDKTGTIPSDSPDRTSRAAAACVQAVNPAKSPVGPTVQACGRGWGFGSSLLKWCGGLIKQFKLCNKWMMNDESKMFKIFFTSKIFIFQLVLVTSQFTPLEWPWKDEQRKQLVGAARLKAVLGGSRKNRERAIHGSQLEKDETRNGYVQYVLPTTCPFQIGGRKFDSSEFGRKLPVQNARVWRNRIWLSFRSPESPPKKN